MPHGADEHEEAAPVAERDGAPRPPARRVLAVMVVGAVGALALVVVAAVVYACYGARFGTARAVGPG